MTAGRNSLMFFLLFFSMLRFFREVSNVSKRSLLNFSLQPCSELCQDAALWRQEIAKIV